MTIYSNFTIITVVGNKMLKSFPLPVNFPTASEERKNTNSLNTKITNLNEALSDSTTNLYHYKLGLSQVEARHVEFKTQEIKLCEKIRGLEFDVKNKNAKIENLMNKLEQIKKEKEGLDSKLTGFKSASKDLDTLLGSQRSDKNKEGLGYNVVPSFLLKSTLLPRKIWKNWSKNNFANKNVTPRADLFKTASVSATRRVNTAAPRPNMNSAQPKTTQDLVIIKLIQRVKRGTIDQTLFIKRHRGDFILVQVYVDDIIFGSSNPQLCREFEALMHEKFQMSVMGELNFFLGLQVLQKKDGIFLSQDRKDRPGKDVELHLYRSMIGSLMYLTASRPDIMFAVCACARHQVTPKECYLHAVKRIFRYLKGPPKLGLWYHKESLFNVVAYLDSDYGGATQYKKSTTRRCQFLGRRLISWQCKKQTIMATSITEAKYVAVASGCRQVLWIQNQLLDYGYHFIRDCFEKKLISVDHIHTDDNVVDLLTKHFDARRRNLKLNNEEGISSLPDAELFENLALMGYNILPNQKFTFQKGFNEFSSNIATAMVCLATDRVYNFSKMIFDGMSKALPIAANEPASLLRYDSQGEAFPTVSGLEARQDRKNIIKTSALPHDSTPRVTSLAADEGTQDLEISNLKARIRLLEDKDKGTAEFSRDDALIKGRSLETGEEAGVEKSTKRGSNDTEELVNVLTSMDAVTILTSGVQAVSVPLVTEIPNVGVPTSSGLVPTANPIFTTASVVTPYLRRKGKEKMVESETPKKKKIQEHIDVQMAREMEEEMARDAQRMNEQIARDAEIARIHAEKELSHSGWKTKHFKGMTLEEIREKFIPVWKKIKDFVLMASKEEGERVKRKGLRLEQGSAKKIKTSEEVSKEDLKEMMQLVPVEEVYVEALQVELKRLFELDFEEQLWTHTQALMHDPVEWRLYDTCGVHHMFTRDQEIFMLVEKDYPLRRGLAIVMINNKLQMKYQVYGRIVGNKMLKSFPLPVKKILLPEYFPTASEEKFPLLS
uniref:Reverse transcriptase Ty1/copia-type domain-containing protein n=1 Tax=Tanacetum cinerariifolium TaxID=118510 RepID=A0A6L2LVS7_TANCI|nr:hypothetical protein [Tanacetum cinerariifolium]